MLTYALLSLAILAVQGLVSILPTAGPLTSQISESVALFAKGAYRYNDIFPIAELFDVLKLSLLFQGGIFLFRMLNWIYNKVRGTS